jgi:hypothetical protein
MGQQGGDTLRIGRAWILVLVQLGIGACREPPPGEKAVHESEVARLALRHRIEFLAALPGADRVVYCVEGVWDLSELQGEGHAVRTLGECIAQGVPHATHTLPPAATPFWREHPISAPVFVEKVSWPNAFTVVVEILDGGAPAEAGVTARTLSRYTFDWSRGEWRMSALEHRAPDNNQMQRTKPARAMELRR